MLKLRLMMRMRKKMMWITKEMVRTFSKYREEGANE